MKGDNSKLAAWRRGLPEAFLSAVRLFEPENTSQLSHDWSDLRLIEGLHGLHNRMDIIGTMPAARCRLAINTLTDGGRFSDP
eukprot:7319633-Heterocapsa_arctica.AAC.1